MADDTRGNLTDLYLLAQLAARLCYFTHIPYGLRWDGNDPLAEVVLEHPVSREQIMFRVPVAELAGGVRNWPPYKKPHDGHNTEVRALRLIDLLEILAIVP